MRRTRKRWAAGAPSGAGAALCAATGLATPREWTPLCPSCWGTTQKHGEGAHVLAGLSPGPRAVRAGAQEGRDSAGPKSAAPCAP